MFAQAVRRRSEILHTACSTYLCNPVRIVALNPFQELQKKYEEDLRKHETDLSAAQKEKDELLQQAKNTKHEPSNKIAEQRRKRIQELEQSISDLKKKMVEQQRAIKINEKNHQTPPWQGCSCSVFCSQLLCG